jgi:benzoyl-CoA reductase/2-hydroxyglutaryl-CoA dehydratase subunit BcrC/BadD/HgdB
MTTSPIPIQTLGLLRKMNEEYYQGARTAAKEGKKVGFVNVFAPTELFYAMDIIPIYPENHAVFVQARKMTLELLRTPEKLGYVPGLCSYALCDLGSALAEKSPVGGLPRPDFFLTTNAQCGTLTKWFERMSEHYDVPLFLIDVPFTGGKPNSQHCKTYVHSQILELIAFLEGLSGKGLDSDRLRDVINISNETISLWGEIIESAKNIPAPISVFDQFFSMAPIVAQRGSEITLQFYKGLKDEITERVDKGIGAVPHEKLRLYWDSLPLWHELKWLSDLLTLHGASLVSTIYTLPWAQFRLDPDDPVSSWTEEYVHYFDWHLNRRVDLILGLKEKYTLNGFIYHSDRSCKMFSTAIPEIKRIVQEKTGIPGYILEADHGDPRFYSREQIERGLNNYFEILAAGG